MVSELKESINGICTFPGYYYLYVVLYNLDFYFL